jgi:hypothetical protein
MSDREAIIQKVRETWPEAAVGYYPARHMQVYHGDVPAVRDGGMTSRLIEHAVDTVLADLEASK